MDANGRRRPVSRRFPFVKTRRHLAHPQPRGPTLRTIATPHKSRPASSPSGRAPSHSRRRASSHRPRSASCGSRRSRATSPRLSAAESVASDEHAEGSQRCVDFAWAKFGESRVLLRQNRYQAAWAALLEAKHLIDRTNEKCSRRQAALLQLGHELNAVTQSWLMHEGHTSATSTEYASGSPSVASPRDAKAVQGVPYSSEIPNLSGSAASAKVEAAQQNGAEGERASLPHSPREGATPSADAVRVDFDTHEPQHRRRFSAQVGTDGWESVSHSPSPSSVFSSGRYRGGRREVPWMRFSDGMRKHQTKEMAVDTESNGVTHPPESLLFSASTASVPSAPQGCSSLNPPPFHEATKPPSFRPPHSSIIDLGEPRRVPLYAFEVERPKVPAPRVPLSSSDMNLVGNPQNPIYGLVLPLTRAGKDGIPRRLLSSAEVLGQRSASLNSLPGGGRAVMGIRRSLPYTNLYRVGSRCSSGDTTYNAYVRTYSAEGIPHSLSDSVSQSPSQQQPQEQEQEQGEALVPVKAEETADAEEIDVCDTHAVMTEVSAVHDSLSCSVSSDSHHYDPSMERPLSPTPPLTEEGLRHCFRDVHRYQEARELHQCLVRRLMEARMAEERREEEAVMAAAAKWNTPSSSSSSSPSPCVPTMGTPKPSRAALLLGFLEEEYHQWLFSHLGINGGNPRLHNIPSTTIVTTSESSPAAPTSFGSNLTSITSSPVFLGDGILPASLFLARQGKGTAHMFRSDALVSSHSLAGGDASGVHHAASPNGTVGDESLAAHVDVTLARYPSAVGALSETSPAAPRMEREEEYIRERETSARRSQKDTKEKNQEKHHDHFQRLEEHVQDTGKIEGSRSGGRTFIFMRT